MKALTVTVSNGFIYTAKVTANIMPISELANLVAMTESAGTGDDTCQPEDVQSFVKEAIERGNSHYRNGIYIISLTFAEQH